MPTDVTKVRQFLGYYCRFIPGFSRIAHALHALTKKNTGFEWTCETAFKLLKECLVTAPVLSYPQSGHGKEFVLETDASGTGLGAVLSQDQGGQLATPHRVCIKEFRPTQTNVTTEYRSWRHLVWFGQFFIFALTFWVSAPLFIRIMQPAHYYSTLRSHLAS